MLYEFELSHFATVATKYICIEKSEVTVKYNIVTKYFKKFHRIASIRTAKNRRFWGRAPSYRSKSFVAYILVNRIYW